MSVDAIIRGILANRNLPPRAIRPQDGSDWRSNMDVPGGLLSVGPRAPDTLRPGPAPTGSERVYDAIRGYLPTGHVYDRLAGGVAPVAAAFTTDAYDMGQDVAKGGNPAMLAMSLLPGAKPVAKAAQAAARLPMDFASRMARAKANGFRMTPVYNGTATTDGQIFSAFDPLKAGGRTSGSRVGEVGVSVTPNPDVANEFAFLAAQKSGGNPAVMPLLHRTERPVSLNLDGTEKNLEVAATLKEAFDGMGNDAVVLRNYTTPSGKTGETAVVLRNPNQLRSINAAFDPARINDADLMASRLSPFILGGGLAATAAGMPGDAEAGQ